MVTLCSVLSWCPVWKTFPVQSVWSCAASAGNSSNRARKMPTKSAVSRFVTHCFYFVSLLLFETNECFSISNLFLLYTEKERLWNWDESLLISKYTFMTTDSALHFFAPFSCLVCIWNMLSVNPRVSRRRNSREYCQNRRWAALKREAEAVVLLPKRRTPKQRSVHLSVIFGNLKD